MDYIKLSLVTFFALIKLTLSQNEHCLKFNSKNSLRNPRIIGGINSDENEMPFIVSLTRHGGHYCGATIINENWLLTAAHCICNEFQKIFKPTNIKGVIGLYKISDYQNKRKNYENLSFNDDDENQFHLSSPPYEIHFKSIIAHPNYKCNSEENDIALLETSEPIIFTNKILPICIPTNKTIIPDNNFQVFYGTVFGWGWTNENYEIGDRADILQKAKVKIWENDKCQKSYTENGMKNSIENSQLCAGYEEGGIDSCWADSGGPLIIEKNSLIGIVSTGIGCGRKGLPGIYTRVSNYIEWISTVMSK